MFSAYFSFFQCYCYIFYLKKDIFTHYHVIEVMSIYEDRANPLYILAHCNVLVLNSFLWGRWIHLMRIYHINKRTINEQRIRSDVLNCCWSFDIGCRCRKKSIIVRQRHELRHLVWAECNIGFNKASLKQLYDYLVFNVIEEPKAKISELTFFL